MRTAEVEIRLHFHLGYRRGQRSFLHREAVSRQEQIGHGVVLVEHLLHGPSDFASKQPFEVAQIDTGQFGKAQTAFGLVLGRILLRVGPRSKFDNQQTSRERAVGFHRKFPFLTTSEGPALGASPGGVLLIRIFMR